MTPLANGPERFGRVTRALHWLMALGVISMLGFGTYLARMEVSLSNLWLFGLHKTVGIALLGLVLLRLVWHRASPPPGPISDGVAWHHEVAVWTHRCLYLLLVLIPLSGWIAASATGLDVMVFGRWTLPPIAPVSERWEAAFFAVHAALTKLVAALVLLHIAGAMRRRDGTLGRMVRGVGPRA